jgi:UDP-N-acetylmuramoyl-L-alanyl-D-glutamate--2,6-diaminopimelate ligase
MSMPAENLGNHGTLDALLQDIADAPAIDIAGISSDSRKLGPGFLFLAIQGATSHGLEFLAQAEAAGAAAVAYDASTGSGGVESEIPLIPVEGLAHRLGEIANRWYGFPSHDVHVTGVTGTNGKTTVAYLAAQCLTGLGSTCGYIGTLGSGIDDISGEGAMTTPVCIDLHELLAGFRSEGARHAAIEVSSHALEQARVDGVRFDSAIFTNLSRDHIDYHGSMDAYFESKASLFLDHDVRNRIVSLDTEYGVELAERCGANVVTVSSHLDRVANGRPHVFVRSVVAAEAGSNIGIRSSWGEAEIQLPLPGDFNVANAMEVLALLLCNDISLEDACAAPASIEAALKALRLHCRGELWCVFGCGGDRDRGKRPMMGKVAERLSDHAIVTSDNPRTEPPAQIIADILEGMGEGSRAIVDRAEAIAFAINGAAADDVILIAGKGHENYQVIGEQTLSFSDFDAAVDCLSERGAARK